jgi:membrane-bound lytic murein transglycosylase A
MVLFILRTFSILLLTALLNSCQQERPPLTLVPEAAIPLLTDDTDRASLLHCARLQKDYLEALPPEHTATIGDSVYPLTWLQQSMTDFIAILEETPETLELNSRIQREFMLYQAAGRAGKNGEMLVTGYYEPLFDGSMVRKEPYIHPLYSIPEDLISQKDPATDTKTVGKLDDKGAFHPYWTRAEIEINNLLAGKELVYLKDPFDAFLLHIQGSGRIKFADGSQKSVRFASHNGHTYRSIGKLLVDEGKLSLKEASIPTIRHYYETHPEEQQRILHHNPRFIFFNWGDDMSPPGSIGKPLTAGRSIAIDRSSLPVEFPAWLMTERPRVDADGQIINWVPTTRFVLPQDSGAAIQGPGRVDLFWGNGIYAETAASHMKAKGKLYFLVKKGYPAKDNH